MTELNVKLHSWIIQDGNYDDFEVNQDYQFALEFYISNPIKSINLNVSFKHLNKSNYEVNGKIIFKSNDFVIGVTPKNWR